MNKRRLVTSLVLGALALVALPQAANAATAYASDKISIFSEPRNLVNDIVGLLQPGEVVTIDRCTPTGRWCRVFSQQATGWVPASYLIGAAAKADATPLRSLTVPDFPARQDNRTQLNF